MMLLWVKMIWGRYWVALNESLIAAQQRLVKVQIEAQRQRIKDWAKVIDDYDRQTNS